MALQKVENRVKNQVKNKTETGIENGPKIGQLGPPKWTQIGPKSLPRGVLEGLWGSEGGPGGVLEESRGVLWVLNLFEGGLGGSWAGLGPILKGSWGGLGGPC